MIEPDDNTPCLPEVTVITPVYNGERYISEAVESVLNQTHKLFEYIIVDDGSTDGTREILESFAARDDRIVLAPQSNQGQAASLNQALEMASNDWVAILDHDDHSEPTRLERQVRALVANPEIRVLGTYVYGINAHGKRIGLFEWGPTTVEAFEALKDNEDLVIPAHPSVMLHRPTILALGGYDGRFGAAADAELWSRVSDQNLILALPEPLTSYRIHNNSMSFTSFFEQRRMTRLIWARQYARRRSLHQMEVAEFLESERGLRGLRCLRDDWRDYLIGLCGTAKSEGRSVRRFALLAAALALDPRGVVPRVGSRLRPIHRRAIGAKKRLPKSR
ncbi:MAG: glycosyltransferase [Chloroflexia bacterium]